MPTTTQKLVHYLLLFNNCNHKIKCLEFVPLIPVVNPYQSMFFSTKLSCLDITYTCSDRKSKPSLKFGILHSMSCSVVSTCSCTGTCSKTFMHCSISPFSFSVRVVGIPCSLVLEEQQFCKNFPLSLESQWPIVVSSFSPRKFHGGTTNVNSETKYSNLQK